MPYGIYLKIAGDYALFTRPEMKVERVSYDVITPSAARGVLEAIYWKPEIRWIIDQIHVLNKIRTTNIRRNEISSKIPTKGISDPTQAKDASVEGRGLSVTTDRQQRAALVLKDVCYVVKAHFEILPPKNPENKAVPNRKALEGKHLDMFRRRARIGQYFHQPYLGCREFPARFELLEDPTLIGACDPSLCGEKDLGYLLHDIEYQQEAETKKVKSSLAHFFRATMIDGVIQVPYPKFLQPN